MALRRHPFRCPPLKINKVGGNVMYIPAAPMCEKNLAYAHKVKAALEKGASPGDFPREDYETNWEGRFYACRPQHSR